MDYRIFSMPSGEGENSTEAHVLARAYRAVWRATHGFEPNGRHQIASLKLVLEFGEPADTRVGTSRAGAASTSQCVEPVHADVHISPEGEITADLWTRIRRLIGNRIPSAELAKVLADLRPEQRSDDCGSAKESELPHPVNRLVIGDSEHDADDANLQQNVRHASHDRTRAR